ncbi:MULTISPECIES: UDP-4-amino-4,6-dideoxy-N-acetyl-beta-L-altrosamine N-acetyltransferase [Brevibacillus]|uniref:UDP-4-amino-4, 6-dideoxy-N-acetyl-beta-L-altrosamine N-acetyltransferase n=1 Tax=Brevibacillus TaxID=55080 RepID=UPI0012F676E6|nr:MULTISPECIES: UDP-4-amino-4,6-dideoxy-N-acetyl-beta-L-altrosamine N-acetyltransferase [Brevibacillus]MED1822663.1 UDP-4-amino-4,6-dideoxy-N-acetyl-beta-L-altrosamine N-acetyltransferase [Brevibacillus agri]
MSLTPSLRKVTESDLATILRWRNSERIRTQMIHQNIISWEEHVKWFKRISVAKDSQYLVFLIDNLPIGMVNFTEISLENKECQWGFYIGEERSPKGSGTTMGILALDHIFHFVDIVYGEVIETNIASIRFHEKLGFSRHKKTEQRLLINDTWMGTYSYSLRKAEWFRHKGSIL